mmetsp:Transcript_26348/g.42676  ORF Transcript_26348/g.42676 Transcript_26348/m.42676 type:complete len:364 (-) Transcript_26348:73-1164(-)
MPNETYVGTVFEPWAGLKECTTRMDCFLSGGEVSPLASCSNFDTWDGGIKGRYCACDIFSSFSGPRCTLPTHLSRSHGWSMIPYTLISLVGCVSLLNQAYKMSRNWALKSNASLFSFCTCFCGLYASLGYHIISSVTLILGVKPKVARAPNLFSAISLSSWCVAMALQIVTWCFLLCKPDIMLVNIKMKLAATTFTSTVLIGVAAAWFYIEIEKVELVQVGFYILIAYALLSYLLCEYICRRSLQQIKRHNTSSQTCPTSRRTRSKAENTRECYTSVLLKVCAAVARTRSAFIVFIISLCTISQTVGENVVHSQDHGSGFIAVVTETVWLSLMFILYIMGDFWLSVQEQADPNHSEKQLESSG